MSAGGDPATLTVTFSEDLTGTNYTYGILDETTGTAAERGSNSPCSATAAGYSCTALSPWQGAPQTYLAQLFDPTGSLAGQAGPITISPASWTLALTADQTVVPSSQDTHLRVALNQNILATNYSVRLVNQTTPGATGVLQPGGCPGGYSCSWDVLGVSAPQSFVVELHDASGAVIARSNAVVLVPPGTSIALAVDKAELAAGDAATLTATVTPDLSGSGDTVQIIDETAGHGAGSCAASSHPCTATAAWTPSPQTYIAELDDSSGHVLASSDAVTVSPEPFSITLATDKTELTAGDTAALTATVNQDLSATPYGVEILDETTTEQPIHDSCGNTSDGYVCHASAPWQLDPHTYQAEVVDGTTVIAVSGRIIITSAPFKITLVTDKTLLASGDTARLTATVNQDLQGTSLTVVIVDTATGTKADQGSNDPCGQTADGYVCHAIAPWQPTSQSYEAEVVDGSTVVASGGGVTIHPKPWAIFLWANPQNNENLLADANQQVNGTPYGIVFVAIDSRQGIGGCDTGETCMTVVSGPSQQIVAVVTDGTTVVAMSAPVWAPSGGPDGNDPAENNCGCNHGDPVYTSSGLLLETATDMAIPGRGPALALTRTYNSLDGSYSGLFGTGWSSNLSMHLIAPVYPYYQSYGDGIIWIASSSGPPPWYGSGPWAGNGPALTSSSTIRVVEENGESALFTANADGSYTPRAGVMATLVHNSDGSFTFIRRGQTTFRFDASGLLDSESDPNGNTLTLTHASNGQLTQVTDDQGRTLTFAYNHQGTVSCVTDPAGRVTHYSYDGNGDLVEVEDPNGALDSYAYNAQYNLDSNSGAPGLVPQLHSHTDPDGNVTTNTYDEWGRVSSQTDGANRKTNFYYFPNNEVLVDDPLGNTTAEIYSDNELTRRIVALGTPLNAQTDFTFDPNTFGVATVKNADGQTWRYGYDAAGNRTLVTDPDGNTARATYNSFDEPLTVTDANNVQTVFTYDAHGNPLTVSRPVDSGRTAITRYAYSDPANPGLPTTITDPNGNPTSLGYDANGDLTSLTAPGGEQTTYRYGCASGCENNIGWLYSSVSPRGNAAGADPSKFTTSWTRNADGQVTSVTDPLNHTTAYQPDANGNVITMTDPRGNSSTFGYNGDNQPTTELRADGVTITTAYYPTGEIQSQSSSATGTLASFSYNARNELTSRTTPPTATNPAGITTSYGYDPAGYLSTISQPGSGSTTLVTTNHYDPAGRLHDTSYSDGTTPAVTYGYDPDGQRTSMTDGTGNSTYHYNLAGWLTDTTNGAGLSSSYGYDLDGNPTTITYPNGRSITRGYNNDDQLTSVTDWHNKTTTFGYDPNGNLTATTYPNGISEASTFGADDAMSSLADTLGSSTLASYTYSRNPNSAVMGATASGPNAGASEAYDYNKLGQLYSYTSAAPGVNSGALSYNPNGDLTGLPDGTTLSYDPADELTGTSNPNGLTLSYGYDPRGNRTSVTPSQGQSATLSYNGANQLTSYGTAALATGYSYDGDGLRASKTIGLSTRQFSYDPVSGSVPLITSDGRENYIYGPNDTPIEQIAASTPITFVYGTTNTDNAAGVSNTLSLTYATKPQPNDRILLIVNENNGTNLASAPNGYTIVGTFPTPNSIEKTVILQRKATDTGSGGSNDPDVGVTLSFALGAPHPASATAVIYRGVDPNNPIEGTPQSANAAGASSVAVPSVTTATDDDQLVLVEDALNTPPTTTWTAPDSTWTSRPTASVSGPLVSSAVADKPVVFAPTTTPTGTTAKTSLPGQLEDVLVVLRHPNATQYIQHDQLGSTRLLTDPQGTITGSYNYTPYGATISYTGPDGTPLRFNGQYQDSESGLYYLRARYYDPTTAAFLTRDPLEDLTGQPYVYANGDPTDFSDPSGLHWWNDAYDWAVSNLDPVSYVLPYYAKEWDAASNGCSFLDSFKYGLEGTAVAVIQTVVGWGIGKVVGWVARPIADSLDIAWRGGELRIGRNFRLAPLGNRGANDWEARLPHYHRRSAPDPFGNTPVGQGIGRHRPWQSSPTDGSWWDRF